jgi:hypothetical protein
MLRAIVDGLALARLPLRLGDDDPIAAAWAAAEDVPAMVRLLQMGAELGIYEVSHVTRRTEPGHGPEERVRQVVPQLPSLTLPTSRASS